MNKNKTLKQIGNNIRKERLKKGLSQEKLAELVGLHRTFIGMVERGEKNISVLNLVLISKTLNVGIIKLLKGTDD